jgi:hypothetical protein
MKLEIFLLIQFEFISLNEAKTLILCSGIMPLGYMPGLLTKKGSTWIGVWSLCQPFNNILQ